MEVSAAGGFESLVRLDCMVLCISLYKSLIPMEMFVFPIVNLPVVYCQFALRECQVSPSQQRVVDVCVWGDCCSWIALGLQVIY
jgi:hypothetical protein